MKVLFVSSKGRDNILVKSQGDSLTDKNIEVDYFPMNKGALNYIKGIFKLRVYLRNYKYDIIHAHYGWSGAAAVLTLTKLPIVISFMGDDLIGTLNKRDRYTLRGKITARINYYLARNRYNFTIVKSENLSKRIPRVNNKTIIPNGVNLNSFRLTDKATARNSIGWKNDAKYVIFVSNPDREEKNYKLAQKATELLNDKNVNLTALHDIDSFELHKYYSAADCLILTSFHEGSPNVVKEAMACGCPIVSTDTGDVRRVIKNTNGCFITSFDPEDVSLKIKMALDFSEKYGRTKGRKIIIENGLDVETIAEKLINVYKKVLKCAESAEL